MAAAGQPYSSPVATTNTAASETWPPARLSIGTGYASASAAAASISETPPIGAPPPLLVPLVGGLLAVAGALRARIDLVGRPFGLHHLLDRRVRGRRLRRVPALISVHRDPLPRIGERLNADRFEHADLGQERVDDVGVEL